MRTGWPFLAILTIVLAAKPLIAEESEHHGPALVLPANGAIVERQLTVRIGFIGHAPHGPAEDSGISFDRPAQQSVIVRIAGHESSQEAGPVLASEGTGLRLTGDHRPIGPHFALLIDAPMPAPGSNFAADANHIAFPRGIPQMTLTLDPGQHSLTLLTIDPEGNISPYPRPTATLVTVR